MAARQVAIFSYHFYFQRRRGGMHWVCDSLRTAGWDARFITCDYSLITRLKGDRRTAFGEFRGANKLERVDDNLSVGTVQTFTHPIGKARGVIGNLLNKITSTYPWPAGRVVEGFAAGCDLVIVESCGALMMIDRLRQATGAPIVYRVSDNLQVVRPVPALLAAEDKAVAMVDAVSLASEHLARRFTGRGRIQIDSMGLDKASFDAATNSPYPDDGRIRVVISGSSGLDLDTLAMAARALPDWEFIQFGDADNLPVLPNIVKKGEVPFKELVRWVKFADIGFAPYLVRPGFEYQAEHSNRLLQYTYSGMASVVPIELCSPGRQHFLGYKAGEQSSIQTAFLRAAAFNRANVPRETVLDWDQLARRLASVERRPSST